MILAFLKAVGRASTTRIAAYIKANQWAAERYLNQLLDAGRVSCVQETHATYWQVSQSHCVSGRK